MAQIMKGKSTEADDMLVQYHPSDGKFHKISREHLALLIAEAIKTNAIKENPKAAEVCKFLRDWPKAWEPPLTDRQKRENPGKSTYPRNLIKMVTNRVNSQIKSNKSKEAQAKLQQEVSIRVFFPNLVIKKLLNIPFVVANRQTDRGRPPCRRSDSTTNPRSSG